MRTPVFTCALLATCVSLAAMSSATHAAPEKPKRPPGAISIENGRKVALTSFEIMHAPEEAAAGAKPKTVKPVLKLAKPLAPGEKKMIKLTGAKGCSYLARWKFEDASDEGPVDLCGDPKIVLTD